MNTLEHFGDRLVRAIARVGAPACVGLDPVVERLPEGVRTDDEVASIESFCMGVLDAVVGVVAAVKVQSACFERFGGAGVSAMQRVCAAARERGLLVILDAKRGDIGISAEHYAAFAFEACDADAVTINVSLGLDSAQPFVREGRGVFGLVRTSNPGSDSVQAQLLADGGSVAELLAGIVRELGQSAIGQEGYSSVGAVVAATKLADAARLRSAMPEQMFLVPGFGAQGGTLDTVRALFDSEGRGALVTSSRGVIFARAAQGQSWGEAVRESALRFAGELSEL